MGSSISKFRKPFAKNIQYARFVILENSRFLSHFWKIIARQYQVRYSPAHGTGLVAQPRLSPGGDAIEAEDMVT